MTATGSGAESNGGDETMVDPDSLPPLPSRAELAARRGEVLADTPLWLSHHYPEQYDRCVVIAGRHVCRRCIVLYPLALLAGVAVSSGSWWPHRLDPWILWLFPLPGVVEFVLDNLGRVAHVPRRQVLLSAAGAVAAGVGYVRYLDDPTDRLVWAVVGVYTAACLAGAIGGHVLRSRPGVASNAASDSDSPASDPTTTNQGWQGR